jgi:hypothetical protein
MEYHEFSEGDAREEPLLSVCFLLLACFIQNLYSYLNSQASELLHVLATPVWLPSFLFAKRKRGMLETWGKGGVCQGLNDGSLVETAEKGQPTMHDASFEPQGDSSMPRQRPAALELPVGHPERGRVTLSSAESSEALQVQKGSALWI